MKNIYLIIFLLLFSNCFSQGTDSINSHLNEIKGWESYFIGKKQNAKEYFKKAIELNSDNILAKIGLFNSIPHDELKKEDYSLISIIPTDKNKMYSYSTTLMYLMMANQVDKELSDSLIVLRNTYDEEYIKFKAALTDSKFKVHDDKGNVRKTGAFNNRKPVGTWNKYGYQNKLHHSYTFPKMTDTIIVNYYKPDGVIIKKEWVFGIPFTSESKKIKEVIFWQENPGKEPEYLFVSKKGFKIYDSENPVEFDETTPDNIIQRIWNPEKKTVEAIIWKNGNQIPYELCEDDGIVTSEIIDGIRKTYRWENCKKVLIKN